MNLAGIATVVWLAVLPLGFSAIGENAVQEAPAQIGLRFGFPAIVPFILIFAVFYFNRVHRSAAGLAVVAAMSLALILPFMKALAGGM